MKIKSTNPLAISLAETFQAELNNINPQNSQRRAKLGQNVLAFIATYYLSVPELSSAAKKLLIANCPYTGEYWLTLDGYDTAGELSLKSTL